MDKKRKSKPCKVCSLKFIPARPLQQVCSMTCAVKFNSDKEIKKRVKQMKDNIKESPQGIQQLEGVAKRVFQMWCRMRDEKEPCISCKTKQTEQWDGGHYAKAEIYSGLIFEEVNVNKQCCYCNGPYMDGNLIQYRKGLILKYGNDIVEKLESSMDSLREYKFTRSEFLEIIAYYKTKIKNKDFSPRSKYLI